MICATTYARPVHTRAHPCKSHWVLFRSFLRALSCASVASWLDIQQPYAITVSSAVTHLHKGTMGGKYLVLVDMNGVLVSPSRIAQHCQST